MGLVCICVKKQGGNLSWETQNSKSRTKITLVKRQRGNGPQRGSGYLKNTHTLFGNNHGLCASLMAQAVKNLPAMQETWVRSLGWEDPLEEGMAIYFSILAWESHGQRSLVGYSSWGSKESDMTED